MSTWFKKYSLMIDLCAISLFTALLAMPLTSRLNVNLGIVQWVEKATLAENPTLFFVNPGNIDTRFFRQALILDRNNSRAHHWLGFANAKSGLLEKSVARWRLAGLTSSYFTAWGDWFQKLGNDEASLFWYKMALAFDPYWSDAWYHIGEIHSRKQNWDVAVEAYRNAINSNKFRNSGISDAYTQLGLIFQFVEEHKNVSQALKMYNAALFQNDFASIQLHAEAYYKRGEIYRWQNRDPRESIAEYNNALSIAPYHRWARLQLGNSLYQAYKDVELSVAQIQMALSNWPDDSSKKWPYRYLGDIFGAAGSPNQASEFYRKALRFDPFDKELRDRLRSLELQAEEMSK